MAQFFPLSKQVLLELEDGEPVGYALYGFESATQRRKVFRLMVDRKFQHRGFGKEAMRLILAEFFSDPTCNEVILCYAFSNSFARRFYAAMGFVEVRHLECPDHPDGKIEATLTRTSYDHWSHRVP